MGPRTFICARLRQPTSALGHAHRDKIKPQKDEEHRRRKEEEEERVLASCLHTLREESACASPAIIVVIFIAIGIIVAYVVVMHESEASPVICVYNDSLETRITFPEDGLCDFVIYASIYYSHEENVARGRSEQEHINGTLEDFSRASKLYQKTLFLAGFPSEYVNEPHMIASRGFGRAIGEFHRSTKNRGHGVFYLVGTFMELQTAVPKLRLFFLTHSKLIVERLTDMRGTVVAMSSSLALKVYNSTAADSTQTDEASASNSSSVHSACAVDFLCIAEACNQTGFVARANAQVGDGAHYERHTNAQNMTVIRTYESESTILRTIGSVVSEMPKNSEAIFGWALVDMNYEDSVGHKCPVYAESEASFARTRAVRQVMLKREGYELRKLLHI